MAGEREKYNSNKDVKSLSCVQFFVTPWTIQFMEFSRPEYWSGEPFPSPGDLPNPEIELRSPALQADSLMFELLRKPPIICHVDKYFRERNQKKRGIESTEDRRWQFKIGGVEVSIEKVTF